MRISALTVERSVEITIRRSVQQVHQIDFATFPEISEGNTVAHARVLPLREQESEYLSPPNIGK
jgi:hypothetical protein